MFLTYRTKLENQLNRKIKRVKSNRGGEYVLFNYYYVKEGTFYEVTPPYLFEINGVVERKK